MVKNIDIFITHNKLVQIALAICWSSVPGNPQVFELVDFDQYNPQNPRGAGLWLHPEGDLRTEEATRLSSGASLGLITPYKVIKCHFLRKKPRVQFFACNCILGVGEAMWNLPGSHITLRKVQGGPKSAGLEPMDSVIH